MKDSGQVIEIEKFTPIRIIGTGWSETAAQIRNYVSSQIVAKQNPTINARDILQIIIPSHQPFGFHDRRDICWISSAYFGKAISIHRPNKDTQDLVTTRLKAGKI